jgi:RHS repeat-associated protein
VDSGTRGTYYFDSLEAHRSTYIGPATSGFSGGGVLARPAFGLAESPALQGGGVVTTTITYDYDPLYRLTGADYSDGSYFDYTYDAVGNRLEQEVCLGGVGCSPHLTTYVYDEANRLVNVDGAAHTWDNNGNLLSDAVNTYEYDAANRLVEFSNLSTVSSYQYNGLGDRLRQTVNATPTTYTVDLNAGLTQVLADGTNTYLYGAGRIGEQQPGGFATHLPDALGSVRQLEDASASVTLARNYEPFGSVLSTAGPTNTGYGFAGEQADTSGLVHLRARYYSPAQGRFVSRDAWPGDVRRPLSLNRWVYTEGNPVNLADPSGRCVPPSTVVCIVVVGGLGLGAVTLTVIAYNNFMHREEIAARADELFGNGVEIVPAGPPPELSGQQILVSPGRLPAELSRWTE